MDKNKYTQLMDNEINSRLTDTGWDFDIAQKVMSKKRKGRNRFFAFSASSVLVSASLVVLFFMGVFTTGNSYSYDSFISQQLSGVSSAVFKTQQVNSTNTKQTFEESLYEDDIDNTIDSALSMRL